MIFTNPLRYSLLKMIPEDRYVMNLNDFFCYPYFFCLHALYLPYMLFLHFLLTFCLTLTYLTSFYMSFTPKYTFPYMHINSLLYPILHIFLSYMLTNVHMPYILLISFPSHSHEAPHYCLAFYILNIILHVCHFSYMPSHMFDFHNSYFFILCMLFLLLT